ncbi:hypothetical protein DFH06DRAFT_1121473 [Mycena polygramma]|nr:hypothetical protein DFH06DRAFT_1121473 [Mycena polygramma]
MRDSGVGAARRMTLQGEDKKRAVLSAFMPEAPILAVERKPAFPALAQPQDNPEANTVISVQTEGGESKGSMLEGGKEGRKAEEQHAPGFRNQLPDTHVFLSSHPNAESTRLRVYTSSSWPRLPICVGLAMADVWQRAERRLLMDVFSDSLWVTRPPVSSQRAQPGGCTRASRDSFLAANLVPLSILDAMLLEVDDIDAKALLAAIPGLLQAPGNPDLARLLSRLQQQLNPPSLGPPLELAPPNRLRNIENTPRDTENLVNKENISRTPPRVPAFPHQHLYSPYGTTLLTAPARCASRGTLPNSEDSPMPMADEESSAPALLPRAAALLPEFMLRALRAASASPPPSRPITPPLCPATPMHPTTPLNRPSGLPSTSILSPLRFSGDDDDNELLSPSSTLVNLSPTKSACGDQMQVSDSSAASLLGKRTAAEAGLEDGPRRSRRLASSVTEHDADGTGSANGGTHHANSKPPCPRKGDKARVSSKTRRGRAAGNVQAMQATLTKELSNAPSGKSGKKKKKTAGGRYVMGAPPPPATRDSGLRIVGLGLVPLSVELQQNLLALLRELQPPPPPSEGVSQEDGPAALTVNGLLRDYSLNF